MFLSTLLAISLPPPCCLCSLNPEPSPFSLAPATSVRVAEHRDEIERLMKAFLRETVKSRAVEAKLTDLERELATLKQTEARQLNG